jgi:hypothetical protein
VTAVIRFFPFFSFFSNFFREVQI